MTGPPEQEEKWKKADRRNFEYAQDYIRKLLENLSQVVGMTQSIGFQVKSECRKLKGGKLSDIIQVFAISSV